jgi:hypothetical protein
MATQTQIAQTVTYRGPTVLVGALAHLLREEGVDFQRPSDDRTRFVEAVEVTLTVRAGETVLDRPLDEMIDTAVAAFRRRFGESPASITVGDIDGPEAG